MNEYFKEIGKCLVLRISYHFVSSLDVDECINSNTHNCDIPTRATCTNTPGSFTCRCKSGFSGNGTTGTCKGTIAHPKFLQEAQGLLRSRGKVVMSIKQICVKLR